MANNEYANRIHKILKETMQDRGTHYLSARVRARAMFQDYSLLKDTVLDPGLNLREAQKLSEFIFSQSSFLLRGETDDEQQIGSWLNLAAQSFEFLSKVSDETEKDYLLINAAFSYHIAGYQANAQCLAKLLEERLATEEINDSNVDVYLALNTKKAVVGFLKRDITLIERVSSLVIERIQLNQSEIINQITDEQRSFLDIFEYSGSAYFHKSLLSMCNYWRTGSENEYEKANSEMEKSSEYFVLATDTTFAVLARELITAYKTLEEKGTWSNISANGGDLIQDRVWQTYLRNLAFEESIVDFWASQLHALRSQILTSDDSFVIQMPTSAGKTLIAELVILAELTSKKVKCLYIAPYRALVNEVERNLADSLGALGYKVSNLLGNFEFDGFQNFLVNEADVLVATPEKAELFLRTRPEFFDNLGVVIVDEGHIIDEGWRPPNKPSSDADTGLPQITQAGRGVLLEFLMSRMKARLPSTRFIFMSAVMNEENANDFVKWLSKDQEHSVSIDISRRPSRLITAKFFWEGNSGKFEYLNLPVLPNGFPPFVPNVLIKEKKTISKAETVASLAISMARTDPILVFCAMKKEVRLVAEKIIELLAANPVPFLPFTESPNLESYDVARRWLGDEHTLTKVLRYGVGIHYGPLPEPVREAVESDFKQKKISILISTNTLGQGVNLPIKTAIIYSVVRRWGKDSENIKKHDFWNICGRAGRAGKETEGQVIFVVISPTDNILLNEFKDYANIENINSALFELLKALIRQQIQQDEFIKYIDSHIIALMAENVVDMENDESILGFLKSSLVGVQAIKNNVDLTPLVGAIKETARWISSQVPDVNLRKVFARTGLSTQSCLQIESAVNKFLDRARAIMLTVVSDDIGHN
ncbi:MAG: DEAD/DEAH box helicase [Chloroflexi bacterium]|nr:DEAD/DEAH box helicase [Chloroflexota bacterium]